MCLVILVAVDSPAIQWKEISCVQATVHITFSMYLTVPDTALWMCKFTCYIFHIMELYNFCGFDKCTNLLCLVRLLFLNEVLRCCFREKNIKAKILVRVMWFLVPLRYTEIWWDLLLHTESVICVMDSGDEYNKSLTCTNNNFIFRLHSLEDLWALQKN